LSFTKKDKNENVSLSASEKKKLLHVVVGCCARVVVVLEMVMEVVFEKVIEVVHGGSW